MTNEQLAELYQGGDNQALAELYKQNCGFLRRIAAEVAPGDPGAAEDLTQEGFFGLKTAAERYNPETGVPFLGYAGIWVKQVMTRYQENCGSVLRINTGRRQAFRDLAKAEEAHKAATGRAPTAAELAPVLGVGARTVAGWMASRVMATVDSLDKPTTAGEDPGDALGDMVPDETDTAADVCRQIDRERMRTELRRILSRLPEAQRKAIRGAFWEGKTVNECGRNDYNGAMLKLKRERGNPALRSYAESYLF